MLPFEDTPLSGSLARLGAFVVVWLTVPLRFSQIRTKELSIGFYGNDLLSTD